MLLVSPEDEELATEERKKQIAAAVKAHRAKQQKESGRKQVPLMLTDEDRNNMAYIKANDPEVNNQGEAVSKALTQYVEELKKS
jgi:hypothetical protein